MLKKKIFYLLPAVLWFAFSFILLTIPGNDLPPAPFLAAIHFDKIVHIVLFGVLVYLFCVPLKNQANFLSLCFKIAMWGWIYGIAMEFVQKYCVPNRSFDITDIIADGVGCFAAYLFLKRRNRSKANLS